MEWVLLGIVVLALVSTVWLYNRLVTLRNRYKNAFAQIDVQLRRRHHLIPNLVETAKGYMQHERGTLEAVIQARNSAVEGLGSRPARACLLLSADNGIRKRQIGAVAHGLGEEATALLRQWWDAGVRAAPEQRLPLLELAVPTMRQRPPEQLHRIDALIDTLIRADGRISVFEYALGTLFRAHLRDVLAPTRAHPGGHRVLEASRQAVRDVLAVLARVGAEDETAAAAA